VKGNQRSLLWMFAALDPVILTTIRTPSNGTA
jgi:hypothetical protein